MLLLLVLLVAFGVGYFLYQQEQRLALGVWPDMRLLVQKALPKGEVLGTARIAGILAAKRTFELIPLCHPLPLDFADVSFDIDEAANIVHVTAEARTSARTGVEMEALLAAQVAAATIYDMCKAVQKDIRITNCRLVYKSGGKSGLFESE